MKLFDILGGKARTVKRLLNEGVQAEEHNDLEAAYEAYRQAAELGSGRAMAAIGTLYAAKDFRVVEQNNLMELMQQGIPAFPWNVATKTVPDIKTAVEWYCKAAEAGDPQGCAVAGTMLCDGVGCQPDLEQGLAYLKKALSLGVEEVRPMISVFDFAVQLGVSDEAYEEKLQAFIDAVEQQKPERYALYSVLKGGTERQLTRLGHTLITRRNLNDPKYGDYKYLFSSEGLALLPCCARRANWATFVRVDLNAFSSDDVLLTFSSDISCLFVGSGRLRPEGSVVYRSPAFGWLKEEKVAMALKIDRQYMPEAEDMRMFIEAYHMQPKEYAEENAAFILENGEKEYSVEIAAIQDGKVQILYRYTIGGSDAIKSSFEPELIELRPNQDTNYRYPR